MVKLPGVLKCETPLENFHMVSTETLSKNIVPCFSINVAAVSLKSTEAGLMKQIKCSEAFISFLV